MLCSMVSVEGSPNDDAEAIANPHAACSRVEL
jgi:hypothetical protein